MHRYIIDVGSDCYHKLSALAEREHTSNAEIIKRAVASYAYLKDELKPGMQLSITDAVRGDRLKDIDLP